MKKYQFYHTLVILTSRFWIFEYLSDQTYLFQCLNIFPQFSKSSIFTYKSMESRYLENFIVVFFCYHNRYHNTLWEVLWLMYQPLIVDRIGDSWFCRYFRPDHYEWKRNDMPSSRCKQKVWFDIWQRLVVLVQH